MHIVTCHIANDKNGPENDVSSNHFDCNADFPSAQLSVDSGEINIDKEEM